MDGSDNPPHGDASERRPDLLLAKIRLWTRTSSSYSQEPVAVDETPATRRIADLSSITARTRSHPSRSSTRNSAIENSHAHGQSMRTSAHHTDRLERSRALCAKYGFDLTESDLPRHTSQPVQRVERPIRMRIRFWCHHCNTQYGSNRVCEQCAHRRCNRCARHPPRRTAPRLRLTDAGRTLNALSTENLQAHLAAEPVLTSAMSMAQYISIPVIPETDHRGRRQSPARIYTPPISQELLEEDGTRAEHVDSNHSRISKRPRVRVRRICHECQRTFVHREFICSGCGHERCKECPRNPSCKGNEDVGSSKKCLERGILSVSSESDDGGDEDEHQHETAGQGARTSTRRRGRAGDTAASSLRGSCIRESTDARETGVTPADPPPPPPV